MIRKRTILTIFGIMLGVCMLGLFGCGSKIDNTNDSPANKPDLIGGSEKPQPELLYMEDVLDIFSWTGSTLDEIGISYDYMDGSKVIYFTGKLFGNPVGGGRIYFLTDYDTGREEVENIYCTCDELTFEDAEIAFTKVYGRPYEVGEEPYVEVNGGAVAWRRFYTDTGTVQVSHPSESDYIFINASIGTLPDGYKLSLEELNEETGFQLSLDSLGFEELSCRYDYCTGIPIYGISYLFNGDSYHLDILRDCEELPEMYLECEPELSAESDRAAADAEIRLGGDGTGSVLWREFSSIDVWIIYMKENATEEKLLQMKELLQDDMWWRKGEI